MVLLSHVPSSMSSLPEPVSLRLNCGADGRILKRRGRPSLAIVSDLSDLRLGGLCRMPWIDVPLLKYSERIRRSSTYPLDRSKEELA
jgi:hypothetical protein